MKKEKLTRRDIVELALLWFDVIALSALPVITFFALL